MELSHLLYITFATCLCYLIAQYIKPKLDPREPPSLPSKIPVIGHVIGIARHGFPYIVNFGRSHKYPIFTVDFLVAKVYVVTSSKIVQAIQRNSNAVSWDPVLGESAHRLAGINGEGWTKLKEPQKSGGHGKRSLNQDIVHAMQPALLGSSLDGMMVTMAANLSAHIDKFAAGIPESGKVLDLWEWCREAVFTASLESTWGPNHPLHDPEVEQGFIDFDSNISTLLLGVFPQYTARKAYLGRQKVIDAFIKYYNQNHHLQSSELALARWKTQHEAGCTTSDIAKLETATVIGVVSNTVTTAFWTIFDIFSRPSLHHQLRTEVLANALTIDPTTNDHVVDLAKIREGCPMLISAFQEVLRTRSTASPTRSVTQDVLLNGEILLKKGAMLFMPSKSVNYEPSIWGADAAEFKPERFLSEENQKVRPSSFMGFGAAPALCPGRHFASGEILALVAMALLRFEIRGLGGEGAEGNKWVQPVKFNTKAVATTIAPPSDPFMVKMKSQKEFEGVRWRYKVSEGKGRFGLITG